MHKKVACVDHLLNPLVSIALASTTRNIQLTGHIQRDPETGSYIGMVPGNPDAHTRAKCLEDLQVNLKEVVELCLEEMCEDEIQALSEFAGIHFSSIDREAHRSKSA